MKPLILVGGGGHCKSVIDVAESAGRTILGIIDVSENIGKKLLGYSIVGTDDDIIKYIDKAEFIVTVGFVKDSAIRIRIHEKILSSGGRLATLTASTAHVSSHVIVAEGTVIMHQAVVNAGSNIGRGCIVNTFADIEHDVSIKDYCHISTGAIVNGDCKIGAKTFVGSQAVIVNGVSVKEGTIIAAGAVIRKNIEHAGIYAGNPAKLKVKL